jgi:hypothetical protein
MSRASPPGEGRPRAPLPRHFKLHVPPTLALLAIVVLFLFISDRLTLGPPWLPLAALAVLLIPLIVARYRGHRALQHRLAITLIVVMTVLLIGSAKSLVSRMLDKSLGAPDLLFGGVVLWLVNILTFAVWYWEIDAGGPIERHRFPYTGTDFVFPQLTIDSKSAVAWTPQFVDYLFLAFNTSTAFSPTDTLVLSRSAKALMMIQSLLSLVTIAVLLARGINTL